MIDLNLVIVISLAILAFFSFCLFIVIIPLALQFSKTLSSAQHLFDTINDIEPTVKEIKQSVDSVRNVVEKSTQRAKSALSNASVFVISTSYGVLAGLKDYLSSYKNTETSYNGKSKDSSEGLSSRQT